MKRFVFVALLLSACSHKQTSLLLTISSDLPSSSLQAVEIAIAENPDAGLVDGGATSTCVCVAPACATGPSLPLLVPLKPGKQGTNSFEIDVSAHTTTDCSDSALLTEQAVTHFVENESLTVSVQLNSLCIGVDCGDGETCDPDTGSCKSNVTMGMNPDLRASDVDLAVPPDLSISPFDLAVPSTPFTIANPAPTSWDVATNGSDFTVVLLAKDGTVSWGPVTGLPFTPTTSLSADTSSVDVCATRFGSSYLYGVANSGAGTGSTSMYGPTGGAAVYALKGFARSTLACATEATGVTVTWLEAASAATQTPSILKVVEGTGTVMQAAQPAQMGAASYSLSRVRNPDRTALLYVANNMLSGQTGPAVSEYIIESNNTKTPIALDATSFYAIADTADHRAVVGSRSGHLVFGSDSAQSEFSGEQGARVTLAGLGNTIFAIAVVNPNTSAGTQLEIYGADLSLVPGTAVSTTPLVLKTSALSTTTTPRMAASQTQLLVTWIDGSSLMGQFVTAPNPPLAVSTNN